MNKLLISTGAIVVPAFTDFLWTRELLTHFYIQSKWLENSCNTKHQQSPNWNRGDWGDWGFSIPRQWDMERSGDRRPETGEGPKGFSDPDPHLDHFHWNATAPKAPVSHPYPTSASVRNDLHPWSALMCTDLLTFEKVVDRTLTGLQLKRNASLQRHPLESED